MTKDTELATVILEEVSCEFMYSNPNGLFNLSVPEKCWRNPTNYQQMNYSNWKIAEIKRIASTGEGDAAAVDEEVVFRNW